jgi:hypothetical protein
MFASGAPGGEGGHIAQDQDAGAAVVALSVLPLHDWERGQDVFGFSAVQPVERAEHRIQPCPTAQTMDLWRGGIR